MDSQDFLNTDSPSEGQSELSTVSFEDIMRLQNKVGTKALKKIAYGTTKNKQTAEPMKRLSKHRPEEMSAKKPVPFLRKVVPTKKMVSRDPRFDDLSGEFRPDVFKQTYNFIGEIREKEAERMSTKNQDSARQRLEQQREKALQFKRQQRELVGQGHRPFYLKKSDKKKLELANKYTELKKSGKLENFLSKKRKRNANKDRRKLPC
uniref:rRNA biogenesis protein RRP36 n=1 Tax=Astyanax mexicanus TaxID=7994 RepID=A0A8B9J9F1_ASTMX